MTKCIIIGKGEQPDLRRPIEFVEQVFGDEIHLLPCKYDYIELIAKDLCSVKYNDEYDLMFAHNGDRSLGSLYIGYWNDGVVE